MCAIQHTDHQATGLTWAVSCGTDGESAGRTTFVDELRVGRSQHTVLEERRAKVVCCLSRPQYWNQLNHQDPIIPLTAKRLLDQRAGRSNCIPWTCDGVWAYFYTPSTIHGWVPLVGFLPQVKSGMGDLTRSIVLQPAKLLESLEHTSPPPSHPHSPSPGRGGGTVVSVWRGDSEVRAGINEIRLYLGVKLEVGRGGWIKLMEGRVEDIGKIIGMLKFAAGRSGNRFYVIER